MEPKQRSVIKITAAASVSRTFKGLVVRAVFRDTSTGHNAFDAAVISGTQREIALKEQTSACANLNMLEPNATGAMMATMVTRVAFHASVTSTEPRTVGASVKEANVDANRTLAEPVAPSAHSTTTISLNADHATVTVLDLMPEVVT